MNNEAQNKRRGWIKNVTIIFLTVMLILTFFSNTILNWSLPEVSGQYAGYGQIKTSITGSGTVKANMTYTITSKDTREVKEVLVKKGDHVEAGQSLILLEDFENADLTAAEDSLKDMEYNYEVKLVNHNNSDSNTEINDLREQLAALRKEKEKADSLDRQITGAEEIVKIYDSDYKRYTNSVANLEKTVSELTSGDAANSAELAEKIAAYDEAAQNLADAKTALETANNIYNEISDESDTSYAAAKSAYDAAKKAYDNAVQELAYLEEDYQTAIKDSSDYGSTQASLASASAALSSAKDTRDAAQSTLTNAESALKSLYSGNIDSDSEYKTIQNAQTQYLSAKKAYEDALKTGDSALIAETKAALDALTDYTAVLSAWDEYRTAKSRYAAAVDAVSAAQARYDAISKAAGSTSNVTDKELASMLRNIEQKRTALVELKTELNTAQKTFEEASSHDERLQAAKADKTTAQRSVNEWERKSAQLKNEMDKMVSNETKAVKNDLKSEQQKQSAVKEKLDSAQTKLDSLKADMPKTPEQLGEEIKTAQKQLTTLVTNNSKADSLFALEIQKDQEAIEKQREKVEKLKEKTYTGEITAKVTGTISNLNCVAGQKVDAGSSYGEIEVDGKGYAMEISVTNEQAASVHVGDRCSITDYYWGPEVKMTVASIKPDTSNPGKGKILEIEIDGEVSEGQSFNLSIGDRQTSYDLVVPNSAIREDSNGKYILIASVKSTPLGNRYIAKRVNVTVIKKDNLNSAVDAGTEYGYEYVITSSTAPVEEGSQVRLAKS